MEFTFLRIDKQTVLQVALEDMSDEEDMLLRRTGKDKDVVEVDKHKPV